MADYEFASDVGYEVRKVSLTGEDLGVAGGNYDLPGEDMAKRFTQEYIEDEADRARLERREVRVTYVAVKVTRTREAI